MNTIGSIYGLFTYFWRGKLRRKCIGAWDSFIPNNVSCVTCHMSHVKCHLLRVMCHLSPVTWQNMFKNILYIKKKYRFQGGLPRLVYSLLENSDCHQSRDVLQLEWVWRDYSDWTDWACLRWRVNTGLLGEEVKNKIKFCTSFFLLFPPFLVLNIFLLLICCSLFIQKGHILVIIS